MSSALLPSKLLLVFCDGTACDGTLTSSSSSPAIFSTPEQLQAAVSGSARHPQLSDYGESATKAKGSASVQYATNVYRLSRAVMPYAKDKIRQQIVLYQRGVGSETDFRGSPGPGNITSQILGAPVASKIRDAYVFLAQNFEVGDEICLFGFSRGAYAVRKLAGLIDKIGLLSRVNLDRFWDIWCRLLSSQPYALPSDTRMARIRLVGVWDTVGYVGKRDALQIKDSSLPAAVDIALHALSIHENRNAFRAILWAKCGLRPNQTLKQVWFPGDHSDVGGGHPRHELADVSLFWMAGEIEDIVHLHLYHLWMSRQDDPEPWGSSQPHNAHMEMMSRIHLPIRHGTRLELKQLNALSTLHLSWNNTPETLKYPRFMITADAVRQTRANSSPPVPSLNQFEIHCMNHWHDTQPLNGSVGN